MSFYIVIALPALFLFLIPYFLPRRWLCFYVPLAAAGIALLWQSHIAHRGEGNGFAEAMADLILLCGTAGAIAGVLARFAILTLRGWGIRWRYAWLPAPVVLALLVSSPTLLHLYREWEIRPPSDACVAATYRVAIAGSTLQVPSAPIFIFSRNNAGTEIYSFAWPAKAREFCALIAGRRVLELHHLKLDFVRMLRPRSRWQPPLCDALRERPWLHQFCDGSVDVKAEHYPDEIVFEASDETARYNYRNLWTLLKQDAVSDAPTRDIIANRIVWRLRATDGTPLAVLCQDYGTDRTSCDAAFEPRQGLAARFHFDVQRYQLVTEVLVVQGRVAAIAADLMRQ